METVFSPFLISPAGISKIIESAAPCMDGWKTTSMWPVAGATWTGNSAALTPTVTLDRSVE
ncbi:MAG: hypothetical protein A2V98_12465 [Planctomycetes bacterium RBG_16_64_12]|nr:MAG: hypothetical protein A2V98_12465 [Planctomycetes bacterium RBG_16_64_12]